MRVTTMLCLAAAAVLLSASSAWSQPPGGRGPGGPPSTPMLDALDVNGDREISAEELSNAVAALKKLDKNDDGKLTIDEMRPRRGPGAEGRRDDGRRDAGRGDEGRGRRDGDRERRDPPPRQTSSTSNRSARARNQSSALSTDGSVALPCTRAPWAVTRKAKPDSCRVRSTSLYASESRLVTRPTRSGRSGISSMALRPRSPCSPRRRTISWRA